MDAARNDASNLMPGRAWPAALSHGAITLGAVLAAGMALGATPISVMAVIGTMGALGGAMHLRAARSARASGREVGALRARLAACDAAGDAISGRLESLIQSMEGGVLTLDEQQRVLNVNHAAEAMLEVKEPAVRGRLLHEVVRQPDLHRFVAEALEGASEDSEFAFAGRPERRVRASRRVLKDDGDRPTGLLIVLTDMTRLRQLESVRTDFASNVSHELRTPITNIKGYVETLQEMDLSADPEQSRRFLGIVAKHAERLGAIVEDMLMLTQLERPDTRETLSVDHTRIAPILESVQAALEGEANKKAILVECRAPADLAAMVNQPLIEQAVTNLLGNALRYSPPRTVVRMSAAASSGRVMISVADQGPGIAEEHLPRLFERFYRVDRARSREDGGTGLGLAIVKHIVNLHRGRVEVQSSPGAGSTFRIHLPAP